LETWGPHNRFSALVVVEKEGFSGILIEVGLGDKYDIAIIGNEGQLTCSPETPPV
jgi:hypothetical protein